MIHLLRVTAFNLPRLTRLCGVLLALLLGVIHVWLVTQSAAPSYLDGLFLAAAAGGFVAAVALLAGIRALGWGSAITVSGLCLVGYLVSRTAGLPGFVSGTGAWHDALGTVSMLIDMAVLALYLSIRIGWNVDVAGARDWDTYFSR